MEAISQSAQGPHIHRVTYSLTSPHLGVLHSLPTWSNFSVAEHFPALRNSVQEPGASRIKAHSVTWYCMPQRCLRVPAGRRHWTVQQNSEQQSDRYTRIVGCFCSNILLRCSWAAAEMFLRKEARCFRKCPHLPSFLLDMTLSCLQGACPYEHAETSLDKVPMLS